jgi:hypothetical protein
MEAMHNILLGDHVCFWIDWIRTLLVTAPPTFIISTSLRLDFANHAAGVRARNDPTNTPTDHTIQSKYPIVT